LKTSAGICFAFHHFSTAVLEHQCPPLLERSVGAKTCFPELMVLQASIQPYAYKNVLKRKQSLTVELPFILNAVKIRIHIAENQISNEVDKPRPEKTKARG
jgi:hypothetical protein